MTSESELKTDMVKNVNRHGGYARRFEDRYGVGIVDTLFIPVGLPPILAEIKKIRGLVFGPTDRQFVELERINEHSPRVFGILIGVKDSTYYFSPTIRQVNIRDCFSVTSIEMPFYEQLVQFYLARLK